MVTTSSSNLTRVQQKHRRCNQLQNVTCDADSLTYCLDTGGDYGSSGGQGIGSGTGLGSGTTELSSGTGGVGSGLTGAQGVNVATATVESGLVSSTVTPGGFGRSAEGPSQVGPGITAPVHEHTGQGVGGLGSQMGGLSLGSGATSGSGLGSETGGIGSGTSGLGSATTGSGYSGSGTTGAGGYGSGTGTGQDRSGTAGMTTGDLPRCQPCCPMRRHAPLMEFERLCSQRLVLNTASLVPMRKSSTTL